MAAEMGRMAGERKCWRKLNELWVTLNDNWEGFRYVGCHNPFLYKRPLTLHRLWRFWSIHCKAKFPSWLFYSILARFHLIIKREVLPARPQDIMSAYTYFLSTIRSLQGAVTVLKTIVLGELDLVDLSTQGDSHRWEIPHVTCILLPRPPFAPKCIAKFY